MKEHISEIHEEGKKPFKCDIFDQSFSQKGNLSKHTASVHDSNKSFKCDICDQIFLQRAIQRDILLVIMKGRKNLNVFMQPKNFPSEKFEKA